MAIHQISLLRVAARLVAIGALLSALEVRATCQAHEIDFNRDIRPILSNKCFACHGPDEGKRQAGLRLDDAKNATSELESGAIAIVPRKPEASELVRRITSPDVDERMPPAKFGKPLTSAEIATLRRWIEQGARYAPHWSYVKPVRTVPPDADAAWRNWPRNTIDLFALPVMLAHGLHPSPEADRYTLARRMYLDLTGLPPTIEEADAFVKSDDPQAYEKRVDDLLRRPSYGEHWARMWLDLARYADSTGYADERPRTIWAYRDWVIKAINENKPFDQFTIEQIAGDLLPNPSEEQLVATAFHRNTLTNNESGTQDEEFRNAAVVDRVNTTMAVWMGTTMACAQCHNHKFDPITQREYFQLFAILNNTEDADLPDDPPVIAVCTDEQRHEQTTVPILRERTGERRETKLEYRGNYLDKGPAVVPGLPSLFRSAAAGVKPDRLTLARWLVDKDNPLTARVVANRFWEALFDRGIVLTSEEFGSQGEPPTHPELLDWLAVELVDRGWDTRALIRMMVTSAVYRQSSQIVGNAAKVDPGNRWLARGPRVRMSAEMVRDQALAVSDLLSRKMYGPPVRPPQPNLRLAGTLDGAAEWKNSEGDDRYRRAIYTSWRRSNPYPSMVAFDAPGREVCTLRRMRTNTPLQSLVTLNDPVYVEAAQALARRAIKHESNIEDQIAFAFRRCLSRPPNANELELLVKLYHNARKHLAERQSAAVKLATVPLGELPPKINPVDAAAMTVVGNVLLNMDEMFLKR